MKTGLFFLVMIITVPVMGQALIEKDILKAKQKQPGVYKTFKEFRTNAPSLKSDLNVSGKFLLARDTIKNSYEKIKEEVYGACINDTVFIFLKYPYTKKAPHFCSLEIMGRYSYFIDSGTLVTYGSGSKTFRHPYKAEYIINMNSGTMGQLDKKLMRVLLKKDRNLLREFEKDKLGNTKYKEYIKKINARRIKEIKPIAGLK